MDGEADLHFAPLAVPAQATGSTAIGAAMDVRGKLAQGGALAGTAVHSRAASDTGRARMQTGTGVLWGSKSRSQGAFYYIICMARL